MTKEQQEIIDALKRQQEKGFTPLRPETKKADAAQPSGVTIGSAEGYKPDDFTDSGNSDIFIREFKGRLIYVKALGWLYWTGKWWKASDLRPIYFGKILAGKMLKQAAAEIIISMDDQTKSFRKHALKARSDHSIASMVSLSRSEMHVELKALDADPYALNTPTGIVDLRTGAIRPHDPKALCANITKYGSDTANMDMWLALVDTVTCGDKELAEYLQLIVGMSAVGEVLTEILVIAYGSGKNGKSTFFNAVAYVLGIYAGTISAEVLTTDKRNKGAHMAELKGKRLIIAAELEEGKRLSTSVVKQLSSTDAIDAERKYKDPEKFIPSHTAVLYTNHKPKVGSMDDGTWRRLALVPFNAKITDGQDIKNYAQKLAKDCGGAIIQWIIDGAVKFLAQDGKLTMPTSVAEVTAQYREESDWLSGFIDERCERGSGLKEKAGELYNAYRSWATGTGNYVRHNSDFKAELERRGFINHRYSADVVHIGLHLKCYTRYEGDNPFECQR